MQLSIRFQVFVVNKESIFKATEIVQSSVKQGLVVIKNQKVSRKL